MIKIIHGYFTFKFTNAYIYDHIVLYVNDSKLDVKAKVIDVYKKADKFGIQVKLKNTIRINICNNVMYFMPFIKGERTLNHIKKMITYDMVQDFNQELKPNDYLNKLIFSCEDHFLDNQDDLETIYKYKKDSMFKG